MLWVSWFVFVLAYWQVFFPILLRDLAEILPVRRTHFKMKENTNDRAYARIDTIKTNNKNDCVEK